MSIGIDYASVDGNKATIDFEKVYQAGVRFAIVRESYGNWDDPTDERDLPKIRAAGIVAGTYAFVLPSKKGPTARAQVQKYRDCSDLRKGDLPPVLDVEFPGAGIAATGLTRSEILAWVREAVEETRRLFGVTPMIYTSKRVWDGEDTDALDADNPKVLGLGAVAAIEMADCPLWLARYPFKTRAPAIGDVPGELALVNSLPWPPTPAAWGDGNHWIHQFQGDGTGFKQFSATVDVNRFRALARGETGRRVTWAQKKLKMAEGTPGVFDAAMSAAVIEYQLACDQVADAVIGPKTFGCLAWE